MSEQAWTFAFVRELLRLASRFNPDELAAIGRQQHAVDGVLDPVVVAQREFAAQPPYDD